MCKLKRRLFIQGCNSKIEISEDPFVGSAIVNRLTLHLCSAGIYDGETMHTVLCKSNANVFRRNSRLFLAFRRKNIEFSMEANFQRKVTIIRDNYYFQLREFLNDNSFGTKIYFEFSSENSQCSIND